ncbi:MAG: hypothetical protein UY89_C0001G0007 [Parcubacteria group bacterium GW2011_GWA1_54_9]|nr:MAG: hypothetical protein UY89_C0001G0007 [Parcubacteria group bacterium GW2011_GWA1_54_9]KKW42644.1 MAG: hypothetical protein UY91_C0002G0010 [Parcubacteria group bacterium GW2011_GWB1_55_9]
MDFLKDILGFLSKRKKFWLLPVIIILLFVGVMLSIASTSALAPFVYTLF